MEQNRAFSILGNSDDGFGIDKIPQDIESYRKLYSKSLENREKFWKTQAESVTWDKAFSKIVDENFDTGEISWFSDGKLNACANALDVHTAKGTTGKGALTYFGKDGSSKSYSVIEILNEVTMLVSALKSSGLTAGRKGCTLPA